MVKFLRVTFGSSPNELKIGQSSLPPIIESSLYGLKAEDKKEYSFSSKNIFGMYDESKVKTMSLNAFANYKDPKPGDIIETTENDKSYFITILNRIDDKVVVDLNHPLSNKEVVFEVEILDVKDDA
jgi:FKBP-type peptidyl-prolyl cis-trans isomerases 2